MKWSRIGDIVVVNREVDEPSKFLKIPGVPERCLCRWHPGTHEEANGACTCGERHRDPSTGRTAAFFRIDLSKVMWSRGNINERARIPQLVEDGETVVDMFAGIGYFSYQWLSMQNPLEGLLHRDKPGILQVPQG